MQDNTQTQQVIKSALLAILVGMIILTFWLALRPFDGDVRVEVPQYSTSQASGLTEGL